MALIARNQEIDFHHYSVQDFRLEVEDADVSGDVTVGPTCQWKKGERGRVGLAGLLCTRARAGKARGKVGSAQLARAGWPFLNFYTNKIQSTRQLHLVFLKYKIKSLFKIEQGF